MSIIQNKSPTIFFMQKNLDENSYEKRIENIEKGTKYFCPYENMEVVSQG